MPGLSNVCESAVVPEYSFWSNLCGAERIDMVPHLVVIREIDLAAGLDHRYQGDELQALLADFTGILQLGQRLAAIGFEIDHGIG